jgi:hypothetical protein
MSLNSITSTYPGFQSLPKGVKQLLLVSESLFFEDAKTAPKAESGPHQAPVTVPHEVLHLKQAVGYNALPEITAG